MYFSGLTECFLCADQEVLSAGLTSNWRALKAENKVYYICPECLPSVVYSKDIWADFYKRVIEIIYHKDFRRPIRCIQLLRDIGGNPRIEARFN